MRRTWSSPWVGLLLVVGGVVALGRVPLPAPGPAAADHLVYADALGSGWGDWSWGTTVNLANASPVHAGSASIAATVTAAWGGVQLGVQPALAAGDYTAVRFFVHGGTAGGQQLRVYVGSSGGGTGTPVDLTPPTAGVWTEVTVTMASLGGPSTISTLVWQDTAGSAQPTFYLDDVTLVGVTGTPTPTPPPGEGPALAIDASSERHPISPDVYGMNFADESLASSLALPVRRWGGNSTSRFNYLVDTSNTGMDWYYENVPQDNPNPGTLPDGNTVDRFVEQDRRTGSRSLVTVPLLGHVAKRRTAGHPFDCGFKVSVYGAQQSVDPWDTDCGNGILTSGTRIVGNDPLDTSVAADAAFVQGFVGHLVSRYGTAAQGGVAYYNLDNEPMLWSDTHRDVHPSPTSYDEMRDRTFVYAAAVKAADPTAKTLGPVVWGWTAYFWSALDWAAGGSWWLAPPDRLAHGDVPFVDWYLQQMAAYELAHGQRILDVLDVHFYPPGVALSAAGSAATQALRLRSTRLLWDETYSEESWIGEPVYLVPRLKQWCATSYPGTGTAVTEYNWGALDHINGALAQADVLGIFGREGLDVATLWGPPEATQPGAYAFRMYRNVDGQGARFGDTSVQATSEEEGVLSVYAAERTGGVALTVMVVNKTATGLTSEVSLAAFTPAGPAQVWRYSAASPTAIVRDADLDVGPSFSASFPASSITLIVVPGGLVPSALEVDAVASGGVSNRNGVIEPGERVQVSPSVRNPSAGALSRTGALAGLSGPAGSVYTLHDVAADYGSMPAGATVGCRQATGDCYELEVSAAVRPAAHWDATVTETMSSGEQKSWALHLGGSFPDVPTSYAFYSQVEALLHHGVTAGCSAGLYCPASSVPRSQMAMFIARALAGSDDAVPAAGTVSGAGDYQCVAGGDSLFADVPATAGYCRHVHLLAARGVTAGCTASSFCPNAQVSRAAMAMFIARAVAGGDGAVPEAFTDPVTGRSYSCAPASPSLHFTDVTAAAGHCRHAHFLWARGVIDGCASSPVRYCPGSLVSRGQMAKFMANGFGLTVYGP